MGRIINTISLIYVSFLIGCSTVSTQGLFNDCETKYNGPITPIKESVITKISPFTANLTIQTIVADPKSKVTKCKYSGNVKFEKLGNSYLYETVFDKLVIGTKEIIPKDNICILKLLVDETGKVIETKIDYPFTNDYKITEKDKLILEKGIKEAKESLLINNQLIEIRQLKTGDVIWTIDPLELIIDESFTNQEIVRLKELSGNPIFKSKVIGWGILDGKKVIVSTISDKVELNSSANDNIMCIEYKGYSLLSQAHSIFVKSNQLITISFLSDDLKKEEKVRLLVKTQVDIDDSSILKSKSNISTTFSIPDQDYKNCFDGLWNGAFYKNTEFSNKGVPCSTSGSLDIVISNSTISGKANDMSGREYSVSGFVDSEGNLTSGMIFGGNTVVGCNGKLVLKKGSGTYRTINECKGTWSLYWVK